MSSRSFVFDITPENFATMVLQNSEKGPVLVYYLSPNAGPCMMLLPRLVNLAEEFGGRFLLTLLNIDEYRLFAQHRGITSIPTVQIYQHGDVVETVNSAWSEQYFRNVLDKYLPRKAIPEVSGLSDRAHQGYRTVLDRAKQQMQTGDIFSAYEMLEKLPEAARRDPEIDLLTTHLGLICTAERAPTINTLLEQQRKHPENPDIAQQLAARYLIQDEYEKSLGVLSELLSHRDVPVQQKAHRAMLAIFALLGPEHKLVQKFHTITMGDSFST